MATPAHGDWTCPTCGVTVATPYCATCGERRLAPADLALPRLIARAWFALSDLDGKVLRTFWSLLRRPGALTQAYVTGQRKPYVAPFQVFLLANVLFFAVQSVSDSHIFGAALASHLHAQDWQATARSLVRARLDAAQLSIAQYAPVFDRAAERNAKSLIILMTVPLALLLAALFHRRGRPFAVHAVLALHVWSFLLVLFSLMLVIAQLDVLQGGPGLRSTRWDNALTAVNVVACALYLFFAVGRLYGAAGPGRILKTLAITAAMGVIVLGYRFAIFLVSLYATT